MALPTSRLQTLTMVSRIPINTDRGGAAKTILSGYYKYGTQTLLLGDYGTSGTVVLEVYEEDSD